MQLCALRGKKNTSCVSNKT